MYLLLEICFSESKLSLKSQIYSWLSLETIWFVFLLLNVFLISYSFTLIRDTSYLFFYMLIFTNSFVSRLVPILSIAGDVNIFHPATHHLFGFIVGNGRDEKEIKHSFWLKGYNVVIELNTYMNMSWWCSQDHTDDTGKISTLIWRVRLFSAPCGAGMSASWNIYIYVFLVTCNLVAKVSSCLLLILTTAAFCEGS